MEKEFPQCFTGGDVQKVKIPEKHNINNMINELCKIHSISWEQAEQYTKYKYYLICALQKVEFLNLQKDS